jgi:hypothetical protein
MKVNLKIGGFFVEPIIWQYYTRINGLYLQITKLSSYLNNFQKYSNSKIDRIFC